MQATSILSRFSPSTLASLATGLLVLWPSPFIRSTAMSASMGLAGYSVASKQKDYKAKTRGPRFWAETGLLKAKDRAIDDLQDRVLSQDTELKMRHANARQLEATITGVQTAKAKVTAELARLKRSVASSPAIDTDKVYVLMTEKNALIETLNLDVSILSAALEHADDEKAAAIADVHARAVMTPSRRAELESTIETLTAEKDALAATVAALAGTVEAIDSTATATIEGCEKDYQALLKNAEARLLECQAQIADLQAKVDGPGRFGGLGDVDKMGNWLIDYLANNGVLTAAVDTDADPDNGLAVTLKAITIIDPSKVKAMMPAMEMALKLCSLPTVKFERGNWYFVLPVNPLKNTAATVALTSNLPMLRTAINDSFHLFIFGGSGSGKSVFLDNAIWLGKMHWPDAQITLADPKYPETVWSSLTPTLKSAESCVDATIELAKTMTRRRKNAAKVFDETGERTQYKPSIFALDEAPEAYAEAQSLDMEERKGDRLAIRFASAVSRVLRVGRGQSFKAYILSQTTLVSKIGLNKGDYGNATLIFLNGLIDVALNENLKDLYEPSAIKVIEKELARRRAQGQQYIGLLADTNTGKLFLFESPLPGYYAAKYSQEHVGHFPAVEGDADVPTFAAKTLEATPGNGGTVSAPQPAAAPAEALPTPKAAPVPTPADTRCPSCSERSNRSKGKVKPNGSQSFACMNNACDKKSFTVKVH